MSENLAHAYLGLCLSVTMSVSCSFLQYPAARHQPSFCSSDNLNLTCPHQSLQRLWHHSAHLLSLSQRRIHLSERLKPYWMEAPGILPLHRYPLLHWSCPWSATCQSQGLDDEEEAAATNRKEHKDYRQNFETRAWFDKTIK